MMTADPGLRGLAASLDAPMIGDVDSSPPWLTLRARASPTRRPDKEAQMVAIVSSWLKQPETKLVLVVVCSRREVARLTREMGKGCTDLRGNAPDTRNFYGRSALERDAVRRWSETSDARGVLVVTRSNATGMNYPSCTHVMDGGEKFEHVACPLTFVRFMTRVPVDHATLGQAAGRCGRHMPGLCVTMSPQGTLPEASSAKALNNALRNENAVDLLLQFEVCDLLTLPETFRPSQFQVAGALVELSMMGVLDENGTVLPYYRETARRGNGGGRLNLARRAVRQEDAASLEIAAALLEGGFDPSEVLPDEHFPSESVANGSMANLLREKTDILAAGLRM
eukprot:2665160-Amphidinium_carterae.1